MKARCHGCETTLPTTYSGWPKDAPMPNTVWTLDEQTEGKHLLLRSYLDGWFPILGSFSGRLLFVDGFAGPGEYADDEMGSPLVALESVRRHKSEGRLTPVEAVFLFIEQDARRVEYLQALLDRQPPIPKTNVHVLSGTFDDHMASLLDQIDAQSKALAPAFVMIDPFGVKGSPMQLIGRILRNPKSECLISFMYEPIRRFHRQPEFGGHLDDLFGTQTWRDCFEIEDETARKQFLHRLFTAQLRQHGAEYVLSFELWKGGRHIYTLYFTTGNIKGCDLMKSCIWKFDPSGRFSFRGYAAGQLTLFGPETSRLARQLRETFGTEWTSIEKVEEFVMGDGTPFHKGHLRRATLQPLERDGEIDVLRPQGGKGFAVGKGIKLRFK